MKSRCLYFDQIELAVDGCTRRNGNFGHAVNRTICAHGQAEKEEKNTNRLIKVELQIGYYQPAVRLCSKALNKPCIRMFLKATGDRCRDPGERPKRLQNVILLDLAGITCGSWLSPMSGEELHMRTGFDRFPSS